MEKLIPALIDCEILESLETNIRRSLNTDNIAFMMDRPDLFPYSIKFLLNNIAMNSMNVSHNVHFASELLLPPEDLEEDFEDDFDV